MDLIGRRALLAAGLGASLLLLPSEAGAVLLPPPKEPPPRARPLGRIWPAERRPSARPGETKALGFWVRPYGDVNDGVFRYWRASCWFPIPSTELSIGALPAAGPVLVEVSLDIPAESQLLTWRRINHKGAQWWRATLKSDGRLNNGRCAAGGIADTGVGCPPGGVCKIGVSIACELTDGGITPPGQPRPRVPRRSTQFRFTLTILAAAPI